MLSILQSRCKIKIRYCHAVTRSRGHVFSTLFFPSLHQRSNKAGNTSKTSSLTY